MREQKSRGRIGGGLGRPDHAVSGNHGFAAGDSFGINIQLGRQGHHDRHDYDHYVHEALDYLHHDFGRHDFAGLGHSFGGLYYPSHTYGYSNYYSPYYSGRHGFGFGFGFGSSLGGLNFGYSNYSYGYPGYFCDSSYYPSSYSTGTYTPYGYGYSDYPTVYTPVDYPTYIDEDVESAIFEEEEEDAEDDEEDDVLDEVEYDPFSADFYDPFGLSQDLSGYWIDDYSYAWPRWGWCRTLTLDPTTEPYYSGSYVLY